MITMDLPPLRPALLNAIYAQAEPGERRQLAKGKMLSPTRMAALALDAAMAQPKTSGGRHLGDALVAWSSRVMEAWF